MKYSLNEPRNYPFVNNLTYIPKPKSFNIFFFKITDIIIFNINIQSNSFKKTDYIHIIYILFLTINQ